MKTINTLALAAFVLTLSAYLLAESMPSAPAQSAAQVEEDLLPPKRQAAPKPAEKPLEATVIKAEPEASRKMLEAVMAGDVCQVAKLKSQVYRFTAEDALAYAESISPSSELAEVLSPAGPLHATSMPKKGFAHRSSRLIWAARLAGLTAGTSSLSQNYAEARKTLLALEKEDEGNGALTLLRFYIERESATDVKTITATVQKLASASSFDFYLDEIGAEVARSRQLSPAHYYLNQYSGYYLGQLSSVGTAFQALKTSEYPSSQEAIRRIAELAMEKGKNSRAVFVQREFSFEQYELARDLISDGTIPSIYTINEQRMKDQGYDVNAYSPGVNTAEGGCDPSKFEDFFYRTRGEL